MSSANQENSASVFSFSSSIEQDIWKGENSSGCEYEWWYFDALSDDASEAIVIFFLDNFVFSPRYNTACAENVAGNTANKIRYPAVAFTYYNHGKPLYRSITEFDQSEFSASEDRPGCRIGRSYFDFKSAPYGNGYEVVIDLPLSRNKRVRARFEWLSIESNLAPGVVKGTPNGHSRNFVAPRSDVTGRISIVDSKGKREKRKFRGTGYHDHNSDTRWMPETIDEWFWGRAHFPFSTAVFYRYLEIGRSPVSKLLMIRDGKIEEFDAEFHFGPGMQRDTFGLGFPETVRLTGGTFEIELCNPNIVESSFFYSRSICDMNLSDGDQSWKTSGIAEYLKPESLKSRWLRRLIDLRVGKDGKTAMLP